MMKPKALVLHAAGTNRDFDVSTALSLAGADPEIVHLNQLRARHRRWEDYALLVLPGGFSHADALGAGKLLALDLISYFADEMSAFVDAGKPVIGICNGFQALVKSGILSEGRLLDPGNTTRRATLTHNERGGFECRWTRIAPVSKTCIWTRALTQDVLCPVAHGEGKFIPKDKKILADLRKNGLVVFEYTDEKGNKTGYPYNPNGSLIDVAGICNPAGNVLGLMPHPEDNVSPFQHPDWTRGVQRSGLPLFQNGVRYAQEM